MRLAGSIALKIIRRPATAITLAVMVGLISILYVMLAASLTAIPDPEQRAALEGMFTFPGAYSALVAMLLTLAILAAAAYAGSLAGSEWSWGSFRVAVARGESRSRYVLVNFGVMAFLLLIGFGVLFVVGSLVGLLAGGLAGIDSGAPLEASALMAVPGIVLSGWWVVAVTAAIAFAVGFAARNAVAGLMAVVGLYFAEQMAALVIPLDVMRLAPITAGTQLLRSVEGGLDGSLVPFLVTLAYLVVALGGLVLVARRVEAA